MFSRFFKRSLIDKLSEDFKTFVRIALISNNSDMHVTCDHEGKRYEVVITFKKQNQDENSK